MTYHPGRIVLRQEKQGRMIGVSGYSEGEIKLEEAHWLARTASGGRDSLATSISGHADHDFPAEQIGVRSSGDLETGNCPFRCFAGVLDCHEFLR